MFLVIVKCQVDCYDDMQVLYIYGIQTTTCGLDRMHE